MTFPPMLASCRLAQKVGGWATLGLAGWFLAGCANDQRFFGSPEEQAWMRQALVHPGENPAYGRFARACHGHARALHEYFAEAYREATRPESKAVEGTTMPLRTILRHAGDGPFASALAAETPEVRSAVRLVMGQVEPAEFPRTRRLFEGAPTLDFPMASPVRGGVPAE